MAINVTIGRKGRRLFPVEMRDPDHIGVFVFIDLDLLEEQIQAARKNKSKQSKWGALLVECRKMTSRQDEFLRKQLSGPVQ